MIIASFYMKNINPDVIKYQRLVVEKFTDIEFEQIYTEKSHAISMTEYMRNNHHDYVFFLDIDAIPLHEKSFDILLEMTKNGEMISGAPQRANHIKNNEHLYVAPSVMCINKNLYEKIGSPSADVIKGKTDVAETWTYAQEQNGGQVNFLDVCSYDVVPTKTWYLKDGKQFGRNTVYSYNDLAVFFHSFQGRIKEQQKRFIDECKKLL